ncbi:MAG: bifunctional chorismate mutase/prephenate dehydrogenase [Succinivibrionaceae bacterium]|nr:bifunctional chorismate mutase/prephenate dehydrogenase [Succinivibrionaceae bacterium]
MKSTAEGGDSLEAWRERIDRADEELIALIARRLELVRGAARAKSASGEGAFSREREAFLLEDRAGRAERAGVPAALATDIFKRLLRESYRQAGGDFPATVSPPGKIVIVGGNGVMGRMFRAHFERSGYEVCCFGHRGWDQAPALVQGARAVIVTVPIDLTLEVIRRVAPLLDGTQVLCDFTSVKAAPLAAMLSAYSGPVVGLHPMFGPSESLVKQVIVTCEGRDPGRCQFLLDQFRVYGATLVECDPHEHDRAMCVIQALRHFTTYAYGRFLLRLSPDLAKVLQLSSPIYRLELMMVGRLFAQDPRLYADIIMNSEESRRLIALYAETLGPELEVVRDSDPAEFTKRFLEVREFFGPLAEGFLRESGAVLAALQDRR